MRRIMPLAFALLLAGLIVGPPALAQQGGNPNEAENRGLTSPEVKNNQDPMPTEQGNKPPSVTNGEASRQELYQALAAVRRAPPMISGEPIPRPNQFASEPQTEMQQDPAGNPTNLFPENYVE
jgi:hypothetical protein